MSDPRKVEAAEKDLADFDREEETRKLEEEIDKQINALNDKISKLEDEKQAWQDLVDEQQRQLERAELELELNMTIEEAIFQGKQETIENYKDAYVAAIDEMIAAMKELMAVEKEMEMYEKYEEAASDPDSPFYGSEWGGVVGGTVPGDFNLGGSNSSSQNNEIAEWNEMIKNKAEARGEETGKKVYYSTDSEGKLHYSIGSQAYADKLAGKKAIGSSKITSSGLYNVDEEGDEFIIPPAGRLVNLPIGTGVIPANMTNNLMEIGKYSLSQLARLFGNSYSINKNPNQIDQSKNITIENLSVRSNNASDLIKQLQNLAIVTK